jgi:hypothetical protein
MRWALLAAQSPLAAGLVTHLDNRGSGYGATSSDASLLLSRQLGVPDVFVDDHCKVACTSRTCGLGVCSLERRSDVLFQANKPKPLVTRLSRKETDDSNSTEPAGKPKLLNKRVFQVPLNAATNTVNDFGNYVRRQFGYDQNGGGFIDPDPQFGDDMNGFFLDDDEDDTTVSHQALFGAQPFQWGTNGLHGCTMVTIVSNRAVWMAHIWEMGGFCGSDFFRSQNCRDLWASHVVDPIFDTDYEDVSSRIDFNLFNQPLDNTQVIIMTPMYGDEDTDTWKSLFHTMIYENKIKNLVGLLQQNGRLGGNAQVTVYEYDALNYDPQKNPALDTPLESLDRFFAGNTQFGHCLFQ